MTQEQINLRIEYVLDLIADEIIKHPSITPQIIENNQKTIRNGIISIGRGNTEGLVLYQQDRKANAEDLNSSIGASFDGEYQNSAYSLVSIVSSIAVESNIFEDFVSAISIDASDLGNIILYSTSPNQSWNITELITEFVDNEDGTETIINPLNVSQFIPIKQQETQINTGQANEFLDTNIYELLPQGTLRQEQINKLFEDIGKLLPSPPDINDFTDENGKVKRNELNEWIDSQTYYLENSISAPQENPNLETIGEEESYITRLSKNGNSQNTNKTIEDLRNRLNQYLIDIDEEPELPTDDRPEYENQSDGYIKFRNLNQGIIIRNTNSQFIEGLNPASSTYLETGFTITVWVRFLDKVSEGTLFNFGNPTRNTNPFGFKLETYVINGNDLPIVGNYNPSSEGSYLTGYGSDGHTWKQIFKDGGHIVNEGTETEHLLGYPNGNAPQQGFFADTDTERFARLVVRDDGNKLRGSHIGMPFFEARDGLPELGYYDNQGGYDHAYGLMTNVRIPTNFNEWYFISATFNPDVLEDESYTDTSIYESNNLNPNFWRNNITLGGETTINSGYGQKCKVEIISRTDLLRARGYKV